MYVYIYIYIFYHIPIIVSSYLHFASQKTRWFTCAGHWGMDWHGSRSSEMGSRPGFRDWPNLVVSIQKKTIGKHMEIMVIYMDDMVIYPLIMVIYMDDMDYIYMI